MWFRQSYPRNNAGLQLFLLYWGWPDASSRGTSGFKTFLNVYTIVFHKENFPLKGLDFNTIPPCLGTSLLTVTCIFVFQLNKTFLTWLIIFKYISNTQARFPFICCFEFCHFFFAFSWYFIIKHIFIFWCPLFFLNHQLTGFINFKSQVAIAKYLSPFLCGITDLNIPLIAENKKVMYHKKFQDFQHERPGTGHLKVRHWKLVLSPVPLLMPSSLLFLC